MIAAPLLVTQRLELWQPQASDLTDLVALLAGDDMIRFLGPARPEAQNQFERLTRNAGSWSLYGYGTFAVRMKGGDGSIIGTCGVFHSWRGFGKGMDDVPEAGWIVRQDHWGQGIAHEAMAAILTWFDRTHGPRRIACMIEEANAASHTLAVRLGFSECGRHVFEDDGAKLVLYDRPGG